MMSTIHSDDQVFIDVCELLNLHKINYWVCHGTLLGIIRENRLLPWDHDIDFAVWDSEVSKEKIINIFTKSGYEQEIFFGDMDCLHFHGQNKKIDISFYRVNQNIASIKWVAPSSSLILNSYFYCVQIIWTGVFKDIKFSKNIFKKAIQVILSSLLLLISFFLSKRLKEKLYTFSTKFMKYTGYSYPMDLMKIKKINYRKFSIPIPFEPEQCLELTYGKEWRVPKKNYIWYREATNLF
jgi:hypothetical protein